MPFSETSGVGFTSFLKPGIQVIFHPGAGGRIREAR
jgi:hypothetical protein